MLKSEDKMQEITEENQMVEKTRQPRRLTDEHKEKLITGKRRKLDELAELRKELEELKSAKSGNEPSPSLRSTLPPPVSGEYEKLKQDMSDLLQKQLSQVFPERDVRPVAREYVRVGAKVAHDREGNEITRRSGNAADPFSIPSDLHEKGWDYQWIRISTHGQEDVENQVQMQENGWRPISADRSSWEGRFMPKGYKGHIHNKGLMLVERPMILTEEAKAEDKRKVREQTKHQREQFGMALPDGFTSATDKARANTGIRSEGLMRAPSDLQPRHELEY